MSYQNIFNCFLFCTLLLFSCAKSRQNDSNQKQVETAEKLGNVDMVVSGKVIALPYFEKGLLLLHSFEYEDSRTAFLKAQELDTTFAMAYWGEAMTYNHTLWHRQEQEKAIAALNKLAPTSEERASLIKTKIEKDFFNAAEILFGQGTKYERDLAYSDYLEKMTKKYPEHNEVSAFYAISLLGASRNGRDNELYDKSARIVQGIIQENPSHPGALHYLIHSYDDPVHAHLAKSAADSYSKVAPDAAHALHMPSHIYVALGRWDDVVTSNIASWNASVKRMERMELGTSARSFHAFNWLQYGLLQRGETEKASKILEDMVRYTNDDPSKVARGYLIAMKGAQLVETNDWTSATATIELKGDDLNLIKKAQCLFIEGMKAFHTKNTTVLAEHIEKVTGIRKRAQNLVGDSGFAMCSAGGYANKPPNQLEIDMVQVMEMELKAYQATLNDQPEIAAEWFEKGMQLDETLSYSFGPPAILKPVHEAYGEWLLEAGQNQKALSIFNKALERQPRRLLSLQGKKLAAELLNDKKALAATQKELESSLAAKERKIIL